MEEPADETEDDKFDVSAYDYAISSSEVKSEVEEVLDFGSLLLEEKEDNLDNAQNEEHSLEESDPHNRMNDGTRPKELVNDGTRPKELVNDGTQPKELVNNGTRPNGDNLSEQREYLETGARPKDNFTQGRTLILSCLFLCLIDCFLAV